MEKADSLARVRPYFVLLLASLAGCALFAVLSEFVGTHAEQCGGADSCNPEQ